MSSSLNADANFLAGLLKLENASFVFDSSLEHVLNMSAKNRKILVDKLGNIEDEDTEKIQKLADRYDVIWEKRSGKKTLFLGFTKNEYLDWQKNHGQALGDVQIMQYAKQGLNINLESRELPDVDVLIYRCGCDLPKTKCKCMPLNLPKTLTGTKIDVCNYVPGCDVKYLTLNQEKYQKYLMILPKFLAGHKYICNKLDINYDEYFNDCILHQFYIENGVCFISEYNGEHLLVGDLLDEINQVVTKYVYETDCDIQYGDELPVGLLDKIRKYGKPISIRYEKYHNKCHKCGAHSSSVEINYPIGANPALLFGGSTAAPSDW